MSDLPHIEEEEQDEELTRIVSYLDGELDDTQMVQVEMDLIRDPQMRSEADILSRTWAMLDDLDEVSASRNFTQSTMASVVAETADTKPTAARSSSVRMAVRLVAQSRTLACFVIGLAGGLTGLYLSSLQGPDPRDPPERRAEITLLENFDLLQNTDQYSSVPSVDLLRAVKFPVTSDRDARGGTDE